METENNISTIEYLDIEDFKNEFLSLRIGEVIPKLEIKRIKKLNNPFKQDNLPGVDYKYIIESTEGKVLMVNSWILWKEISNVIRQTGRINISLELKHIGREDYSIRILPD